MSKPDDQGKLEVAVRVLGNELIALKMTVDDSQNEMACFRCSNNRVQMGGPCIWSRTYEYVRC